MIRHNSLFVVFFSFIKKTKSSQGSKLKLSSPLEISETFEPVLESGQFRTGEGVSQRVYNPSPLTTRALILYLFLIEINSF